MVRCLLGLLGLFALLGIIGIKSRESKESHSTSPRLSHFRPRDNEYTCGHQRDSNVWWAMPFSLLGFIAPLGPLSDDSALTAATLPNRHKKEPQSWWLKPLSYLFYWVYNRFSIYSIVSILASIILIASIISIASIAPVESIASTRLLLMLH